MWTRAAQNFDNGPQVGMEESAFNHVLRDMDMHNRGREEQSGNGYTNTGTAGMPSGAGIPETVSDMWTRAARNFDNHSPEQVGMEESAFNNILHDMDTHNHTGGQQTGNENAGTARSDSGAGVSGTGSTVQETYKGE